MRKTQVINRNTVLPTHHLLYPRSKFVFHCLMVLQIIESAHHSLSLVVHVHRLFLSSHQYRRIT